MRTSALLLPPLEQPRSALLPADVCTVTLKLPGAATMEGLTVAVTWNLLCWRRPGWLVGEFEQFNGRAVFDCERDADAVGWAVGRNQDFAASKLGGEISHFKRDVRNLPNEIRDHRVRFKTHPLHAKFAFLVADDKKFSGVSSGSRQA